MPPNAQTVDLLHPNGEIYTVPKESVPDALSAGYQIPSPEQLQDAAQEAQYGNRPLSAAAAGAARTLPGAVPALVRTGMVNPETFEQLKQRNPISTGVGEVGGIGAQLALLPEGGAAGLASAAGRGVEGAAADVLGQVGAKAAGSALEGALYGANNVVNEKALGDPNLTAERAMSEIGTSALWGAGIGGAFGVGEMVVPPAVNAAKSAASKTMEAFGLRPALESAKEGLQNGYASAASVVSGVPKEDILAAIKNRGTQGVPLEADTLAANLNSQYQAVERAKTTAFKDIRPEETENLITNVDPARVQSEYGRVNQVLSDTIKDMQSQPELYPARYPFKLQQIQDGLKVNSDSSPSEVFNALNELKQNLDTKIKFGKLPSEEAQDAITAIKGLRSEVKQSLENPEVWGQAGARQGEFNEATSAYLTDQKEFQKNFMYKTVGRGGNVEYKVDPTKVQTFLRNAETPIGARRAEALANFNNSSNQLLDQIEKSYASVPDRTFDKAAVSGLVSKNAQVLEQQQQQALLNRMASGAKAEGEGGLLEGGAIAAAGHAAGVSNPVLGAMVAGYQALRYPGQTIQRLVKLEDLATSTTKKVLKGAEALAKPVAKSASYLKGYTAEKMSEPQYTKITTQIQDHFNNMQGTTDKLDENTQALAPHAPGTVAAMHQLAGRALSFLASKIPANVQPGPLAQKPVPSNAQIASFNRYYQAVESPITVLKEAATGSLTHEGIEAIGTVYPRLFEQIKTSVVSALSDRKDAEIPYKHRMMLSLLLGGDVDGSMKPQSIMANQGMLSISNAQTQAQGMALKGTPRTTSKGLRQINAASRALTPMQASNQRGA